MTLYSRFHANVLVKFVDTICIFYMHSSYILCVIVLTIKYQVRIPEQNTLNATTEQFITGKISGYGNVEYEQSSTEGVRLGWRIPGVARSKLAKPHKT